jgi:hypothetical protein
MEQDFATLVREAANSLFNMVFSISQYCIAYATLMLEALQAWIKENGFWYQLSLSLFAAVVFYTIFNLLPQRAKRKKLRPIVIRDLNSLKQDLFFLFCTTMKDTYYNSSSDFQSEIRSGNLKEHDLKLGLQNKCFTQKHISDINLQKIMIPIGDALLEHKITCEKIIDKIFNLSDYTTAKEILLIEEIRLKLNTYRIETTPGPFMALIPSCSYLAYAYYPLYLLYLELQASLLNYTPKNEEQALDKIAFLYDSGKFKACAKLARKWIKKGDKHTSFYQRRLIESLYRLGHLKQAYKLMRGFYHDRGPYGGLMPMRNHLDFFKDDETALSIIKQAFESSEYEQAKAQLEKEKNSQIAFLENNKKLSQLFASISPGHEVFK